MEHYKESFPVINDIPRLLAIKLVTPTTSHTVYNDEVTDNMRILVDHLLRVSRRKKNHGDIVSHVFHMKDNTIILVSNKLYQPDKLIYELKTDFVINNNILVEIDNTLKYYLNKEKEHEKLNDALVKTKEIKSLSIENAEIVTDHSERIDRIHDKSSLSKSESVKLRKTVNVLNSNSCCIV